MKTPGFRPSLDPDQQGDSTRRIWYRMSVTYKKMSFKIFDTYRTLTDVSFNTKNDDGGVRPDPHDARGEGDEEDGSGARA